MKNYRLKFKITQNLKILQFALSFLILIFTFSILEPSAQAGTIVKAPAYLGLNQGLAGCWNLDGAYTKAQDCSGNNHTGTLTNGPTKVQGKVGQALSFNSALSQHVNLGASNLYTPSGTGSTLSAWINSTSMQTTPKIVAFLRAAASTAHGLITDNATFQIYYRDGANALTVLSAGTTYIVKDGSWHHVTAVINGTTVTAYVDGISRASANDVNIANTYAFSSDAAAIGSHVTGNFFTGQIDEVRFYHRALSDQEVYRLYQIGLGSTANRTNTTLTTQGLVGHWTFDGKDMGYSGTKAKDISGNNNHGTLDGGPTLKPGKIGQALHFTGSKCVEAEASATLNDLGPLSVSFWYKVDDPDFGNRILVGKRTSSPGTGRWWLEAGSTNRTFTFVKAGSTNLNRVSATGTVIIGQWTHVVLTWDGSTTATNVRMYVNGSELAYGSGQNGVTLASDVTNKFVISGLDAGDDCNSGWNGPIDDVRLYRRVLSAAEIQHLYDQNQSKFNSSQTDSLIQGLLGYWTLDGADIGNSGVTAKDRSGNNNNGTLVNGPTRTQGKVGQALNFVGSNGAAQHVNLGASTRYKPTGTGATISVWIKSTTSSGAKIIAFQNAPTSSALALTLNFSGGFVGQLFYRNATDTLTTLNTSTRVNDGNWHHFVGVINGTSARVYVDGVQSGSATDADTTNTFNFSSDIATLASLAGAAPFIAGKIDEVRFYGRALSDLEIQKLYNMGR